MPASLARPKDLYLPDRLADVPRDRWPGHIAIIMDGNGRWAQRQGLPRVSGHAKGAESVRRTAEECARLGLAQLTLYCLSSENWKRPAEELDFLMALLKSYLTEERDTLMDNNIRACFIGRREGLPPEVVAELDETLAITAGNDGLTLCLAINYGGRGEIVDAVRAIAQKALGGELAPADITEETISQHLYTAGMPDPDLLIRTAGEMRVSNYLLWQISYAEIWVTQRHWPEFDEGLLHEAIRDYAARQRRFGALAAARQ